MQICGSVHANLRAALQCARRLKDGEVHPDTLDHWAKLVAFAEGDESSEQSYMTRELIKDLQREVAARAPRDDPRR